MLNLSSALSQYSSARSVPLRPLFQGAGLQSKQKQELPALKADEVSFPKNDGSLKAVTVHIKIRKYPNGDLKLFTNIGNVNDPDDDFPYPLATSNPWLMTHDICDHILTGSSFCALANPGGEALHGFGYNTPPFKSIPLGAMDYIPILRKQGDGDDANPRKMLGLLIEEFDKTHSAIKKPHELLLSIKIPPPDRSYSIPKNAKWVPKYERFSLEPNELTIEQLEKRGLAKRQISSSNGTKATEYQIPYNSSRRQCVSYTQELGKEIIDKYVTYFYPTGESEEYTGIPYKAMSVKDISIWKIEEAKPLFLKEKSEKSRIYERNFIPIFKKYEKQKEDTLKSNKLLKGTAAFARNQKTDRLQTFSEWLDKLKELGAAPQDSPLVFQGSNNIFKFLFKQLLPVDEVHEDLLPKEVKHHFQEIPAPLPAMSEEKLEEISKKL